MGMGIFLINHHAALPSFVGWEVYFLTKKALTIQFHQGGTFYKYCILSLFMVNLLP